MEYMIARSWVDHLSASGVSIEATELLLREAVAGISSFPYAFGAILFLDNMLKRSGALLKRAIMLMASAGDEFMAANQITMLHAFENIATSSVDDELIMTLDRINTPSHHKGKKPVRFDRTELVKQRIDAIRYQFFFIYKSACFHFKSSSMVNCTGLKALTATSTFKHFFKSLSSQEMKKSAVASANAT